MVRRAYSFCRLDGSTPMGMRQTLVDEFNNSPSKQVNSHLFCEVLDWYCTFLDENIEGFLLIRFILILVFGLHSGVFDLNPGWWTRT